ncbi:PucR family transcriptional regulator [Halobacillus sp. A5]|uniref:PucR family transcriptional regulator n=1 Tax=Halobacillus sp. A5 TaxID=2880263 RepID=UPI0020A621BA|nr:PucR family transcriptional regulator [Halobacillus sp. A5]MCP3028426.1 PucR family transcriptional regulator [Halobacillus sp. A5]
MKVAEIVDVPALKRCEVIAGAEGTNREILHVNMMDAPDIARFLKPNELLVTTAYHVKDQPDLLTELIIEMNKQGCAALGIKTKRFIEKVPEDIKQLADELSFPIIELPASSSLGDIVNQTLSSILDKRTNELRFAIETHKQFSHHIMSGKGIQQLLRRLGEMVNAPVALLDQYAKTVSMSSPQLNLSPAARELYARGSQAPFMKNPYFTFSTIEDKKTYSVFSVFTQDKKAGFLVVCRNIQTDDHAALLTIEQATNVISFELIKENALKQYSRRVRNEFFLNFTEGMYSSQEEIINRAKEFKLENERYYYCAIGKLSPRDFEGSYTQSQFETDNIYEYIEEELIQFSISTHLFTRGDLCILLFQVDSSAQEHQEYVRNSLQFVQSNVYSRFGRTISFGISNVSRQFLNVNKAFKEAHDALDSGWMSGAEGFIQTYRTKDVLELLRVISEEDLTEFYEYALQQLASHKGDEDGTLLHTLFVYLETHCQISETAKRLFVHRNTVVYRLEKCEELLGSKLNDAETTLQVRLALRIKKMLSL